MGRPKKDPFADLPEEFKNTTASADNKELKVIIADAAIQRAEFAKLKREDVDLAEKKEVYDQAGEVYKEVAKLTTLKIEWCKIILEDRGKV